MANSARANRRTYVSGPAPLAPAMSMAWAKASRLSRSLTSVNGGGRSIRSETTKRLGAVGVSVTSSFLFFSCENNLIEQNARRESARPRSPPSQGIAADAGAAENNPDLLVRRHDAPRYGRR